MSDADVCCDRAVIRGVDPEGAPVVLDAESAEGALSAFVETIDGRVIVFVRCNPKYNGPRHHVHVHREPTVCVCCCEPVTGTVEHAEDGPTCTDCAT